MRGDTIMLMVTVKLNQNEEALFNAYAKESGQSVSSLLKNALLTQIEHEQDVKSYTKAYDEYKQDSQTISHVEFMKELGL